MVVQYLCWFCRTSDGCAFLMVVVQYDDGYALLAMVVQYLLWLCSIYDGGAVLAMVVQYL